MDNTFVPLGKEEMIRVPDGIAHFLEHKLFEKEDHDAFQLFSKQGLPRMLSRLHKNSLSFSCTSNVEQNLNTLLNFVQEPYFSENSRKREGDYRTRNSNVSR